MVTNKPKNKIQLHKSYIPLTREHDNPMDWQESIKQKLFESRIKK